MPRNPEQADHFAVRHDRVHKTYNDGHHWSQRITRYSTDAWREWLVHELHMPPARVNRIMELITREQ